MNYLPLQPGQWYTNKSNKEGLRRMIRLLKVSTYSTSYISIYLPLSVHVKLSLLVSHLPSSAPPPQPGCTYEVSITDIDLPPPTHQNSHRMAATVIIPVLSFVLFLYLWLLLDVLLLLPSFSSQPLPQSQQESFLHLDLQATHARQEGSKDTIMRYTHYQHNLLIIRTYLVFILPLRFLRQHYLRHHWHIIIKVFPTIHDA